MIYLVSDEPQLFEATEYQLCSLSFCKDYISKLDIIEIDTETLGFDPHTKDLLCMQLGHNENQFIIPHIGKNILYFKDLLEDESKLFLFANAKFDLKFFLHQGIHIVKLYDVFLAECVLTTGFDGYSDERGLSLEAMCLRYCKVQLNKSIRDKIHTEGLSTRVIKYAAEDVMHLTEIREKQLMFLTDKELLNTIELENEAVIAFAHLEYNGIKVDKVKWMEVAKEVKRLEKIQLEKLDEILTKDPANYKKFLPKYNQPDLFGGEVRNLKINWSSPKQRLEILQVESPKLEATGERDLMKIRKKNKVAKELLEFNKFAKLKSSFGESFLEHVNPITGRVHSNIWQILQTGRISVKEPNLNQIPSKGDFGKLIRSCFIPEDGNVIVGGDYSGRKNKLNFIWI